MSDQTANGEVGKLAHIVAWALYLVGTVGSFFLPVYFKDELGFSGTQIGILIAVQAVTTMLAAAPVGLANDRLSSRFFLVLGLVLQGAGYALMALVTGFTPFLLVFFLWTLANALSRISLDVQVLKGSGNQGRTRSVYLYQASRYLGAALGFIGMGLALGVASFQWVLLISSVILVVLALPAMGLPPTPVARFEWRSYGSDLKNPRMFVMLVWLILFATHWGAEFTSYGLFLREGLGLSFSQMGFYFAAEHGAVVLTLLWLLRFRRHRDPSIQQLAFWGLLLSGIGHVVMVFPPVSVSVVARMVHGVGDAFLFLVFYLGVSKLFAVERLGGHAGFIHFLSMLGMIVGSLIYGPVGEQFGYAVPLWTSGVLTALLALFVVIVGHRSGRREKQA